MADAANNVVSYGIVGLMHLAVDTHGGVLLLHVRQYAVRSVALEI